MQSFLKLKYLPQITKSSTMSFNKIYCYGDLLDTVQMAKIFPDSKTFVDMKLKFLPNETMANFEEMMKSHNHQPTPNDVNDFVQKHFEEPGIEFENWIPSDWKEKPKFLNNILDPQLRQWATDLHKLWHILGRKLVDDVGKNPQFYSIIHVENPVIIPGGRFREFYYWDSYWILRGLLYSEMYETAEGMLKNFLSIIQRFGFIPNGGRVYYSKRSHPPLLAAMIKSYVDVTGNTQFAMDSVKLLEHEYQFWMNNHTHSINNHQLATYGDKSSGPRPESYREDIETSSSFVTDEAKQEHFSELKAAAESGMDFSSRWFINDKGTNEGTLVDLKTRSIIAVELNAILHWNAKIIAEFYGLKGNLAKKTEYEKNAQQLQTAIESVLWDEEAGAWLDYDMINNKRRNYFTPTNLSPLWMKCYDEKKTVHIAERVLHYINKTGIDKYPGGVPNTLQNTGEQWDFPNVWPPMQYILIMGLNNLNTPKTKELAYKWTKRWVQSNYAAYNDTKAMFEKYDAETFGGFGGGGEYETQIGFGWSNGVIIELLAEYGKTLTATGDTPNTTTHTNNGNSGAVSSKQLILSCILTTAIAVLFTTVGNFL